MSDKKRTIVLLSGGADSTTVLYKIGKGIGRENLLGLIVDYGRLRLPGEARTKEWKAAFNIAQFTKISCRAITISGFPDCNLRDRPEAIPDASEGLQATTVVPGRNTILLGYALSYAEALGYNQVAFGPCAEDHLSYPDCRPIYCSSMNRVMRVAAPSPITLVTPYLWSTKDQMVKEGLAMGVPFSKTYTCYRGGIDHCGECDACKERIAGFKKAKVIDPVSYGVEIDWTGCQPYDLTNERSIPSVEEIV